MRIMESTSGIRTVVEPTAVWLEDGEEYWAGIPNRALLAGLMVGIVYLYGRTGICSKVGPY